MICTEFLGTERDKEHWELLSRYFKLGTNSSPAGKIGGLWTGTNYAKNSSSVAKDTDEMA
jgi:hypothetical protein